MKCLLQFRTRFPNLRPAPTYVQEVWERTVLYITCTRFTCSPFPTQTSAPNACSINLLNMNTLLTFIETLLEATWKTLSRMIYSFLGGMNVSVLIQNVFDVYQSVLFSSIIQLERTDDIFSTTRKNFKAVFFGRPRKTAVYTWRSNWEQYNCKKLGFLAKGEGLDLLCYSSSVHHCIKVC